MDGQTTLPYIWLVCILSRALVFGNSLRAGGLGNPFYGRGSFGFGVKSGININIK